MRSFTNRSSDAFFWRVFSTAIQANLFISFVNMSDFELEHLYIQSMGGRNPLVSFEWLDIFKMKFSTCVFHNITSNIAWPSQMFNKYLCWKRMINIYLKFPEFRINSKVFFDFLKKIFFSYRELYGWNFMIKLFPRNWFNICALKCFCGSFLFKVADDYEFSTCLALSPNQLICESLTFLKREF